MEAFAILGFMAFIFGIGISVEVAQLKKEVQRLKDQLEGGTSSG